MTTIWPLLILFFKNTFQSRLLDHFLHPLKNAFPVYLPTEILLKIWQMCQPQTVLPVSFIDRKEARKFLLLIKTTVLAAYNLAVLGAVYSMHYIVTIFKVNVNHFYIAIFQITWDIHYNALVRHVRKTVRKKSHFYIAIFQITWDLQIHT